MVLKFKSITQFMRIPACCPLCQQLHRSKHIVCSNCQQSLLPINNPCRCCAASLNDVKGGLCGRCIKQPPAFDRIFCHYQFDDVIRLLLHRYKYQNALYLRDFLAQMILDALTEMRQYPECLIPVPLHPARMKERGFNQSAELTKRLAKKLHIPSVLNLCSKEKHTPAQVKLDARQRQRNLENAFSCKPSPYRHIAIIDDLLTTGSTVQALASVLKRKGVQRVDVWCCARTPR